ncbi:UNVERIFIED_CONTAM: hypothetical protein K2H54_011366 [Gekko kuhli]
MVLTTRATLGSGAVRIDLPPSHKPAPPPPKRKQEAKSHLTAEDIQVVHLDNMKEPEEEIQKLPPQPPYYDMAANEPAPHANKMVRIVAAAKPGLNPLCVLPSFWTFQWKQNGDLCLTILGTAPPLETIDPKLAFGLRILQWHLNPGL